MVVKLIVGDFDILEFQANICICTLSATLLIYEGSKIGKGTIPTIEIARAGRLARMFLND